MSHGKRYRQARSKENYSSSYCVNTCSITHQKARAAHHSLVLGCNIARLQHCVHLNNNSWRVRLKNNSWRVSCSNAGEHIPYIILEHCPCTDLFSFLESRGAFPMRLARHYFLQLMSGVDYIHDKSTSHRCLLVLFPKLALCVHAPTIPLLCARARTHTIRLTSDMGITCRSVVTHARMCIAGISSRTTSC